LSLLPATEVIAILAVIYSGKFFPTIWLYKKK